MSLARIVGSPHRLVPLATRQRLTVANAGGGVGLPSIPAGAMSAVCTLETAQIRFTLDGTAPTSSAGKLLEVGQTLTLESREELTGFLGIRTGGSSGVLDIEYFSVAADTET